MHSLPSFIEPPPHLVLLDALTTLYTGYILVDGVWRLLLKTTDIGGLLRYRTPRFTALLAAAILYAGLTWQVYGDGYWRGSYRMLQIADATAGRKILFEWMKVVLLGRGVEIVEKRWTGNYKGAGRRVRDKKMVYVDNDEEKKEKPKLGDGMAGPVDEIRRLREERVKKLEAEAAARKKRAGKRVELSETAQKVHNLARDW
ncbi:hypothetical protein FPQ18DRAFT_322570 [Pyronema domesticum]|uniref:Uncharacterized protein n=1 Tax=Pyronema omphalodes (strain CBS 100304) TaxID=1076935 RepID=U4LVC4_PYROM|nr:hypothetical protein FPQ18DRAFT_322570 [Pyronema domesticum]CCX32411.1 Protein of unknown function [Pyronema omphalodes CBS 100304]